MFPIIPAAAAVEAGGNDNGIFGWGGQGAAYLSSTNLISNVGVAATDVTGVGQTRKGLAGCEFGEDKGIFGYGEYGGPTPLASMTNLVSNVGVVATDTTGVGTKRDHLAACSYGDDKGIFGYGDSTAVGGGTLHSQTNLVSNVGVVATDTTGVGTARRWLGACEYGGDKGIFGYGDTGGSNDVSITNLVSNVGVVATDTTGVGTARNGIEACSFGTGGDDKGIFAYGDGAAGRLSMSNLVSNAGVVATDVTGVGTARFDAAACEYGGDKGIFGYGTGPTGNISVTNLVTNVGVVGTDVTGVGSVRESPAACSWN